MKRGLLSAFQRTRYTLSLLVWVLWDLLAASVRVGIDVVVPRHRMQAAVIAYPLDLESDALIAVFANIISLTPGTLTLDISEDRHTLFIHIMHVPRRDVAAEQRRLKDRLERRIKLAFG